MPSNAVCAQWELYGLALYVAMNNIFGGGCEITAGNYWEFYLETLMLLIGSALWAYIIGSACGIISTLSPVGVEYRQTMDQLNSFVDEQGIPLELASRLRAFFRNSRHLILTRQYDSLLRRMSTSLWGETSYILAKRSFAQVPYLSDTRVEPEYLLAVAVKFKRMVFSRLEPVSGASLTVLQRGVLAKSGSIKIVGSALGIDMILSNPKIRDIEDAVAMTFAQVQVLHAADLFDVLACFPQVSMCHQKCRRRSRE
jgi:hypothetical protein